MCLGKGWKVFPLCLPRDMLMIFLFTHGHYLTLNHFRHGKDSTPQLEKQLSDSSSSALNTQNQGNILLCAGL